MQNGRKDRQLAVAVRAALEVEVIHAIDRGKVEIQWPAPNHPCIGTRCWPTPSVDLGR